MNEEEQQKHKDLMIEHKKRTAFEAAKIEARSMSQQDIEEHLAGFQEMLERDPDLKKMWENGEWVPK